MQIRPTKIKVTRILLLFLLAVLGIEVQAQEMVNERFYKITLTQALTTLAKKHYIHIAYNPTLTEKEQVNLTITDKSVEDALKMLTRKTSLTVQKVESRSYIIKEKTNSNNDSQSNRKKKYTISGYVSQEGSGEKLIAASVAVEGKAAGAISNEFGFYSLTLEEGSYNLIFTFVGYQPTVQKVDLSENRQINVSLSEGQRIQEVVITQKKENELHLRPQMSLNTLSMSQVKVTPVLFGEADVLKTIQLLPGVKSGSEGTSGIYVRGGTPDQNLILLDGVPVYNASHMLGFFSVFNADAINSTQIYKGGFPARYGERLSSVIDVRMKEGNMQKYEGEFAIGLISSKLSVSGPIVKDKTSFIVSARRTYADLLIKGAELLNKVKDDDNSNNDVANIYFYDINAKVNHKFSDTDRLYLSYYGGKDITKAETKDTYTEGTSTTNDKTSLDLSWGNTIGAVRWNHIFSPQLFANTTATYTRYSFNVNTDFKSSTTNSSSDPKYNRSSSSFFSGIDDLGAKVDFDYFPSTAHAIKLGASATYHTFTPSASESSVINEDDPSSNIKQKERKKTYAKELAIYAEDTYDINQTLSLNAGVRGSLFLVDGASYHAVEPRLSFNIKTTESSSVKLSYVEMTQYLHFLTSGSMALPSDLWVPTTSKVKPQRSKQVALGITKTLNKYNLTLETYYKKMDRIIEYKDGAYFDENDTSWEDKVTAGKGTGYGVELMGEKRSGKLTGWISYTLSWADRKFDDLNAGRTFPFSYDKRHDISVVLNYKPSNRIDFGATWVYNTGRAFTLGTETYKPYTSDIPNVISSTEVSNNSDRNNIRLPAYHRFDIGVNFRKKKKWGERTWSVGVYNIYNRKNTFFVYPNTEKGTLKSFSLFTVIPSISYSYKF